jgi:hypothetical protein
LLRSRCDCGAAAGKSPSPDAIERECAAKLKRYSAGFWRVPMKMKAGAAHMPRPPESTKTAAVPYI